MKKVLFTVYQSPVGNIWVNEALRTAFGMYGEDIEPAVLFIGEATAALNKNLAPEKVGVLPVNIVFRYIKKYETEVYAVKEDVEKLKISEIDENWDVKLVSDEKLSDFLHSFDLVVTM